MIGERIKALREAEALTMRQFASRLAISSGAVSQIENGKTGISGQTIRSICREFGVSETWLRTGEGEMYQSSTREEELGRLVAQMFADRPDSFRTALITTLLRFDPDGLEWAVVERIFRSVQSEMQADPPPDQDP